MQADGRAREFFYDQSGKLARYREPNGKMRIAQGEGVWTEATSAERYQQKVSVSRDGTVRIESKDRTSAMRTDGWEECKDSNQRKFFQRETANGSTVIKNDLEQIVEVKFADGKSRKFEYDSQGQMAKVIQPWGSVWSIKDGNWTKEGANPPETWKGSAEISPDGTYREVGKAGYTYIYKNDGSQIQTCRYGQPGKDQVLHLATADGKTYTFGRDDKGDINEIRYPGVCVRWESASTTHITGPNPMRPPFAMSAT